MWENIEQFGIEFEDLIKKEKDFSEMINKGGKMLGELLISQEWSRGILSDLVLEDDFLKSQWRSSDFNELQIYRSPDKLFSVKAYLWEPNVSYPIHDHGSWGILGAHISRIREKKFVRLDDGSDENYAKIKQIDEIILSPGETSYVLPLDEGIHHVQGIDETAFSIQVYGSPVRKGYLQYYNAETNSVRRSYSESVKKRIIAVKILGNIKESWSEDVLKRTITLTENENIKEECRKSLAKIKD